MSESAHSPNARDWLSVANPTARFVLQADGPALTSAAQALGFESDVGASEA